MYCHYCGIENNHTINKNKPLSKLDAGNCFCDACRDNFYKKIRPVSCVFCVFCGEKIKKGKKLPIIRYCEKCSYLTKTPQEYAYYLNKKYPQKIKITYKCRCDIEFKIRHHPDYNKPFIVEELCLSCHQRAHHGHDYKNWNMSEKEKEKIEKALDKKVWG